MEVWEGLGRKQVQVTGMHQCTDSDVHSGDRVLVIVTLQPSCGVSAVESKEW